MTDPLQIIVNPLISLPTELLFEYLSNYILNEEVEMIVFGLPVHTDGQDTALSQVIKNFAIRIKDKFPSLNIDFQDESFSSVEARKRIWQSGLPQMKRRDKSLVDRVSAVLILQEYLGHL